MWYARGSRLFSNIVSALPITVWQSEGYELRNAYLYYYLVPLLMGIYLIMTVVLLLTIPKNKMQSKIILPIAIILSLIMKGFNAFGRIFGGMNGVL
ncbi:hypothetical protein J7E73_18460 [Paenibacillus albidus]|nr:hypothetical protein [Paenibacillus albidus]